VTSGIDGIGKHPKDKIECEFDDQALDLRIIGLNNKNLRLKLGPLGGLIEPAKCKLNVKTNSISSVLMKQESKQKHWEDIKAKKGGIIGDTSKKPKDKAADKDADPQASLMNMMKDMYDKGDDDMKRTIAESWSKA